MSFTRILFPPGPHGHMRTRCGTEGGTERVILQTGGYLRFYFTTKAFGRRIRLFGRKPFVVFVRT
jgi:hypothetical protein